MMINMLDLKNKVKSKKNMFSWWCFEDIVEYVLCVVTFIICMFLTSNHKNHNSTHNQT